VTPTFTVVVAAYNAERTIGAAITSVLNQSRPDFELVVVDDGSQDRTAEIAEGVADARVHLVRQTNGGTASARNTGIEQSSAPLIAILDSDDLWLPNYLETMAAVLEDDEHAVLAYTDAWVLDDATRRIRRRTATAPTNPPATPPSDPRQLLALLLQSNFIYVSTTFRRRAIERIGAFDARCFYEDYELWLRFAAAGYRIARAPGPLAIYRDRVDSKSSDERVHLEGLRATLELVLAEYRLDDGLRYLVERRVAALDREVDGRWPRLKGALRAWAKRLLRPYLFRRTPPGEVAAVLEATTRSSMR
jgi:glycosyltransferase involved in cell wall biosynthesis